MNRLELLLHEVEIRFDPDATEAAIEGGASVIESGTVPPDDLSTLPGFRLGAGSPDPVPEVISDLFGSFFVPPADGPAMWFSSVSTIDGSEAPEWYVIFNTDGVDLWGVDSLPANTLSIPGIFEFGQLNVRLALRVRGAAVTGAHFEFSGAATCTADLAGIGLDSSTAAATWSLVVEVGNSASLSELIDDPGRILDTPFTGEFHAVLDYSGLSFPGGELPPTVVTIDARASSDGDGELTLEHLRYDQTSTGALVAGPIALTDLHVAGEFTDWSTDSDGDLELAGSAVVSLPATLDSGAGTSAQTSVRFRRDADGIRFELNAERIHIDPAINILELTASQFELVATLDNGDWSLQVRGSAVQSWSRLANRLRDTGLQLQTGPGFPHLAATMSLDITSSNQLVDADFALTLAFVDAVTAGAAPIAYRGPLGFLPIDVADVELDLTATIANNQLVQWQASGSGTISSGAGLRDLVDVRDVAIEASIGVGNDLDPSEVVTATDADDQVELVLRVSNLPPMAVPAPNRDGNPIELLQIDELQVWLSDRLEVTSSVQLLPSLQGSDLAEKLGMPEWNSFFEPVGDTLGGQRGWFRFVVPFDGGAVSFEVELRPPNPPTFDLAAIALEIAGNVGLGAGAASIPDDAKQLTGTFATVSPRSLRFAATLGSDDTSLALSASATCTLLGESFDAVMSIAVVNGVPEMSILAGVDDPIHVALSAGGLIDSAAAIDVDKLIDAYGVAAAKQSAVHAGLLDMHRSLVDFFTAPGMDFDLAFEIRNLGVTFRPTDGDQALQAGGALRLTQLPSWLERVLPGGGPQAVLATGVSSIRIELQMPTAAEGATRVEPLFEFDFGEFMTPTQAEQVFSLVLKSLMLEYNWTSNSVRVGWDVGFNLPNLVANDMVEQFGSGLALPPPPPPPIPGSDPAQPVFQQLASSGKFGTTLSSPPIPTVEWSFTSGDPADTSQRGAELVLGVPGQRFLTLFSRQFSLFPTYLAGQPALVIDGGMIIGNPPEDIDRDTDFVFMADLQGGVVQLMPTPLGLIINPAALIPPYLTPQPPYWLLPPTYMVDIYANAYEIEFNVPGVLGVSITLERPVPSLSLPAMLELGLLALSGFDVEEIPATSPIRDVCYVRLEIDARLPIVELLGGSNVPELHLELEANVADLLELALHLGTSVRDTLEVGNELATTLLSDPDRLVKAVPVEARQFTTDIEVLKPAPGIDGFTLHGSLLVLTSEELLEETVLYHESKRRRRQGVAALDDPCAAVGPSHGTVVETSSMVMAVTTSSWRAHVNPRAATPRNRIWSGERGRAARIFKSRVAARNRKLDGFIKNVVEVDKKLVDHFARELSAAKDVDAILKALEQSFPEHQRLGQAAKIAVSDVGPVPRTAAAQKKWRAAVAAKMFESLKGNQLFVVGVGTDAEQLAEKFVDKVFRATRARGSRFKIDVVAAAKWPAAYADVTGAAIARSSPARAVLSASAKALRAELQRRNELTKNEYLQLRKGLVDRVMGAFAGPAFGKRIDLETLRGDVGAAALSARFDARWTWNDVTVGRFQDVVLYDAILMTNTFAKSVAFVAGLELDAGGMEKVDRPVGWHVVVNDNVVPALDVVLDPPLVLQSPRADVAVRFRSGAYELVVRDHDGAELMSTAVPPEVLVHPEAGLPGPGRDMRLRAMFRIVERLVPDFVARPAESVCSAPHLYQDSVFSRREYRIDPTGDGDLVGVHGPLSLGDLLRDPATGDYVRAPGPVLLGGLTLSLDMFGSASADLQLTGLIAPNVQPQPHAPPEVSYSVYLEGFSHLEIPLPGGFVVELDGSFTLITGDLWTSAIPGASAGDSLRVDGSIVFRKDRKEIFRGSVHGTIAAGDGDVEFALDVQVAVDLDVEVEVAGFELGRLWTCDDTDAPGPATFEGHISYSSAGLTVTARSAIRVCVAVAQLEFENVEITPETTLCSWVPKFTNGLPVFEPAKDGNGNDIPFTLVPVLVKECLTVPAVVVPVPTIGQLGPPAAVHVEVVFDVNAADMITIEVEAAGIGQFTVPLPNLVPGQ